MHVSKLEMIYAELETDVIQHTKNFTALANSVDFIVYIEENFLNIF
jgi:hypothetical protein